MARVYQFADSARDEWVASQAQSLPAGSRILDVGAGPCRYRRLFAHCRYETQDFVQYQGGDYGPFSDRSTWQYGRIDYVCDAAAIPVPDSSYDAVLCTEVLEHVPEPIHVVNEIARILRPGGRVMLTAPLGSGLHQQPYHFYGGYTPHWYQRFLAAAGFGAIEITPNGGFFRHYGQESQRFSALLDPRRCRRARLLVAPIWLITLPWFRVIAPLLCHVLDSLDEHRGFTVGYHVSALKGASVLSDDSLKAIDEKRC